MKSLILIIVFGLSINSVAQPIITNIEPPSAIPGSTVTIYGANFETTPANNIVTFAGVGAAVSSATINRLVVTVPSSVVGPGDVVISNINGTSICRSHTHI